MAAQRTTAHSAADDCLHRTLARTACTPIILSGRPKPRLCHLTCPPLACPDSRFSCPPCPGSNLMDPPWPASYLIWLPKLGPLLLLLLLVLRVLWVLLLGPGLLRLVLQGHDALQAGPSAAGAPGC